MLHQIGAGSLGPVFRGDDPTRAAAVAIKALRVDLAPARGRQVADDLAGLAARLPVHPVIVAPIDAGLSDLSPYIVWPLVAGESLDVALREYGPAACVDALPRLTALADALDRAGAQGAWHGALHPRDIIVSADETWLVGLGLAPILERAGVRLPARRPYTAPEQLDGHASSPESDQFALAAIAYEWLFGRRVAGPADASLTVPLLPGIDRDRMTGAFATALAADPAERFASSTEFVRALERSVVDQHEARIEGMARAARRKARVDAPVVPTLPLGDGGDDAEDTADVAAEDAAADEWPLAEPTAPVARFATLDDDEPTLNVDAGPASHDDGLTLHPDDLAAGDDDSAASQLAAGVSGASAHGTDESALEADAPRDDAPSAWREDDDEYVDDDADEEPDALEVMARASDDGEAEGEDVSGEPDDRPSRGAVVPASAAADVVEVADERGWSDEDDRGDDREPGPVDTSPVFGTAMTGSHGGGFGAGAVIAALFVGLVLGTAAGYGLAARGEAPPGAAGVAGVPAPGSAPEAGEPPASSAAADDGEAFTEAPIAPAVTPPATPPAPVSPAPTASAPAPGNARAPVEPAPAQERPGRLLVRSTPAGAEVRVNGEARGTTPLPLRDLALGAYTVRVTRAGYQPAEARVSLTTDRPSGALELTLDRPAAAPAPATTGVPPSAPSAQATGSLLVESRPPGASVRVDDREVGTTPVTVPALAPGSYRVTIARDGYQTWTTTVRVTAGERARVAASLLGGRFEE